MDLIDFLIDLFLENIEVFSKAILELLLEIIAFILGQ